MCCVPILDADRQLVMENCWTEGEVTATDESWDSVQSVEAFTDEGVTATESSDKGVTATESESDIMDGEVDATDDSSPGLQLTDHIVQSLKTVSSAMKKKFLKRKKSRKYVAKKIFNPKYKLMKKRMLTALAPGTVQEAAFHIQVYCWPWMKGDVQIAHLLQIIGESRVAYREKGIYLATCVHMYHPITTKM